jgi:aerobic-type carbon monoxide dehydrogenase small subunit (CoxS/CutS family)
MSALNLDVNGVTHPVDAAPEESLLSVLRERLSLTGTKYGCGEGQCGACSVLLDGRSVRSCRTKAADAAGKKIVTIEGLASGETLHPVQAAFLEAEAFQCGFCTPGMIVSAVALISTMPAPSNEDIASAMSGNVCRCGTYPRIVTAVRQAHLAMAKAVKP